MEIYVDKLPESCHSCHFRNGGMCQVKGDYTEVGKCPLHLIAEVQNEKAIECLEEVHKTLADAIIEVTEPLEKLEFDDLEKIARCFESKIEQRINELKGKNND